MLCLRVYPFRYAGPMLTRPGVLLRLEGLLVLAATLLIYATLLHGHWWIFAVFFLAPDLSMLGYAVRDRPAFAAALYNAAHTYVLPLLLALAAWKADWRTGELSAAIWAAHIAFDRLLGFGLKYPQPFKQTHLQAADSGMPEGRPVAAG